MNSVQLYKTVEQSCSYLEDRQSSNLIVDPQRQLDSLTYEMLLEQGFRRSGCMVYRPDCPSCSSCQSSRVSATRFSADRSQRRAWKKVTGRLSLHPLVAEFREEHYTLYRKYTAQRHAEGEMQYSSADDYMAFLRCDWCDSQFIELRLDGRLLAVAVTDVLPGSLSAVYTFFDPDYSSLSPGVLAILSQLQIARERSLEWLYLGFWIAESAKMAYKSRFRPLQIYRENTWMQFNE
jgi:arginyl-tRNA--protein-N-Asp/Glu arginylyltransferase